MINMKMSKEEADEEYGVPKPGNAPLYPYGLTICLDDESLAKLGFTDPPAVGTEMTVTAKVLVTSNGVSQQQDGDKEARAELQITDMELTAAARKDTASVLYS